MEKFPLRSNWPLRRQAAALTPETRELEQKRDNN
jgi:hypothetical protein